MAGRWRTWDLEPVNETLFSIQKQNEVEPLIVPGCTREITYLNLSEIVLPKEAFLSSNDGSNVRARGRGRSLANRALGIDKPSRRPGESSDKGRPTAGKPKPTLGSQFFGSEYLYEELFPTLDQSSTKKADPRPSMPTKSVWVSKQKSNKNKQSLSVSTNNKRSTGGMYKSEKSNVLENSTNTKDRKMFASFFENSTDISEKSDIYADTSKAEIKSPSSTFYNCANDVVTSDKNKTEILESFFEESKENSRSQPIISNNNEQITELEILDTNSGKNDSQINKVGFARIETISGKNDLQPNEKEIGATENKVSIQSSSLETIISTDCMTTKASEELHMDKQSESKLSDELEVDDQQNCWTESDDDQLFQQCNNDQVNICDETSGHLGIEEDQNSTNSEDNFQESDWIESEDNHLSQKYDNDEGKIYNHLSDQLGLDDHQNGKGDYSEDIDTTESDELFQQYNDEVNVCDQLSASSSEETVVSEILDSDEHLTKSNHLSPQQDAKPDLTQAVEDTSTIISNDTKENLAESLDMSASDMEMEPCNVLLQNLPLALTEEELRDIVEPYGEMESCNFNITDESSKTCIVRMTNSMSGELLVVSLDGLEVDGCRIKATMDDS